MNKLSRKNKAIKQKQALVISLMRDQLKEWENNLMNTSKMEK